MAVQKISEVEGEPVIGRFYLVPCVREIGTCGSWRPVVGPLHDDREIGFEARHWHYDHRFTTLTQLREMGLFHDIEYAHVFIAGEFRTIEGPALVRKKCLRQMPEYPRIKEVNGFLEGQYKDAKLNCMRCPHRGFDLKGLPVKDGKVICNGHGLQWSVETGELVPRATAETKRQAVSA